MVVNVVQGEKRIKHHSCTTQQAGFSDLAFFFFFFLFGKVKATALLSFSFLFFSLFVLLLVE
jgi:hypothetical protein